MKKGIEEIVKSLLSSAGVIINGPGDADIQIKNNDFYKRVLRDGSLGLGESYMDGWWEVKKLDELIYRILNSSLEDKVKSVNTFVQLLGVLLLNPGKKSKAFEIGERHYDLGNDMFQKMLDKRMVYSCGYWKDAQNLNESQEAKLDLICRKLNLKSGMKVLDIGCGWGGFCRYAAENYGVEVLGVTVSKEQVDYASEYCKGLNVKINLLDYRDLNSLKTAENDLLFDRIVSVGMFEHVGFKNYKTYMTVVRQHLKEDGLFLLHTIGSNKSVKANEPWSEKYIFPNSHLPSIKQIGGAIENLFVMEDWHNFGAYYDKTLMAWFENFDRNWDELRSNYDDRFYRMWKYYLLSSAGSFRARNVQLWQIVLSKKGVHTGYQSFR
ncbi:MAG: cyclopropane fatty acyl phospholipid synthase [Paludibacter sp.]|nr:cyclopropane fatty acyl phospholipid synthase [Paludibacter sp.]